MKEYIYERIYLPNKIVARKVPVLYKEIFANLFTV